MRQRPPAHDSIDRRAFITATGAVAAGALAGCADALNGNGDDDPENGDDEPEDPTDRVDVDDDPGTGGVPSAAFVFESRDDGTVSAVHGGTEPVPVDELEIRADDDTIATGAAFTDDESVEEEDVAVVYTADGEIEAGSEAPDDADGLESGVVLEAVWVGDGTVIIGQDTVE